MTDAFIKLKRSTIVLELVRNPNAFTLLTVIAQRARRTNGFNVKGLKVGEALIGDCRNYGMTQREYRTARQKLADWGFATFKATNKGTIAKLADERIYDINLMGTRQASDKQKFNYQAVLRQAKKKSQGSTMKEVTR